MSSPWPAIPPVLSDRGLTLRLWEADDAQAVYEACQDPDIQRWTGVPSPYQLLHARNFVDELVPEQWRAHTGAHFAVLAASEGTLLGACGVTASEDAADHAELGYWVVRAARGRQVAQRATHLVSEWALSAGGFSAVELFVEIGNEASSRVALNAGFRFDRIVEGREVRNRGPRDMRRYTLQAKPFPASETLGRMQD